MPKPFRLTLDYDGEKLLANYNDGSDIERYIVKNIPDILSAVEQIVEATQETEDD